MRLILREDPEMPDKPPKLRVKRRPPPPRLLEPGDDEGPPTPEVDLPAEDRAAPIAMLRLGGGDLGVAARAVAAGSRPTGILTSLAESRETTNRVRRLTRAGGIAWFADPLLFRTGLEGYRTAPNLQALDYTPGRDADPYLPEEFADKDLERRVGRGVVGTQGDIGASGALSGAFTIANPSDPWLPVDCRLLDLGAAAASAGGLPLLAVLPLRVDGFISAAAQQHLVRAFAEKVPAAWYLMFDGLAEDAPAERILAAIEISARFRALGASVILGRTGDLRRLFWAFGIGTESGLGRYLRFSIPDFRKRSRGPGPQGGPRIELPSLCCSLPYEKAGRLLDAGSVAESECSCPACRRGRGRPTSPEDAAEHDAHVVLAEPATLTGLDTAARIARLDRDLEQAILRWRAIDLAGHGLGRPRRLERQREVLAIAIERGLHRPVAVRDELRLIE